MWSLLLYLKQAFSRCNHLLGFSILGWHNTCVSIFLRIFLLLHFGIYLNTASVCSTHVVALFLNEKFLLLLFFSTVLSLQVFFSFLSPIVFLASNFICSSGVMLLVSQTLVHHIRWSFYSAIHLTCLTILSFLLQLVDSRTSQVKLLDFISFSSLFKLYQIILSSYLSKNSMSLLVVISMTPCDC